MSKKNSFPDEHLTKEAPSELERASADNDKLARQIRQTDCLFGDGKPYDMDRLGAELQTNNEIAAERLLRNAQIVAWVHTREKQPVWVDWLERHGSSATTGYRYLQVAQKFRPEDLRVLKHLPAGAVYEYFAAPEEDLAEFRKEIKAHGTILGHDVNKDDRKSIRELCRDLKREKELKKQAEKSRDEWKLRAIHKEREAAALQERIGEPMARLAAMLDVAKVDALELIRTEPRASQSRMKLLVSQQFYFVFKEVFCSPLGGEPLVEGPEIEGHDRNFYRVIDGKVIEPKS